MPKKKKFIDKKHSVTFHLSHRSQRDPLQACDEASQRVLIPVNPANEKQKVQHGKEAETKYGIYFDDDYDYLQHLKDVDELRNVGLGKECEFPSLRSDTAAAAQKEKDHTLKLSSTLFGSRVETEIGLLNKATRITGPQPDWDPDIVEGLDDDFNFDDPDNILDDNFMKLANADASKTVDSAVDTDSRFSTEDSKGKKKENSDDDADDEWETTDDEDIDSDQAENSFDEKDDVLGSFDGQYSFTNEETKSRFTSYSVSSSVLRRNEGLTFLDDRFEKFFEQYDDEDIGALDHEEIDGRLDPNSQILANMMEEFQRQQTQPKMKEIIEKGDGLHVHFQSDEEPNDNEMVLMESNVPGEKWDCESILSTYSNIYNRPTLISEPIKGNRIKVSQKSGLPLGVLPEKGLTRKQIEKEMNTKNRADRAATYRPPDESTEERKARKNAIKEERAERRQEKKATKLAFRDESIRQGKQRIHAARTEGISLS